MTTRPLLLDLFCGAGGCSVGYHRAGFDVVGVDLKPQPRYPFPLLRADALGALRWLLLGGPIAFSDGRERRLADVAAVHASPPCQAFSSISRVFGVQHLHPDLVAPTRELLRAAGRPWVMENVPRSPLAKAAAIVPGEPGTRERTCSDMARCKAAIPFRSGAGRSTRSGPISTAVGHVLATSPETTIELNLRIRNSSVTELAYTPKRHMLVTYNTLPHLDDAAYADWVTYS